MKARIVLAALLIGVSIFVIYKINQPDDASEQTKIKKNEKYYQTILCQELGGELEHILPDRTRVDCLTDTYAIEVDFGKKWAEAVGQALYYGAVTKRHPAIGLIIDTKKEQRFLDRLQIAVAASPLKIEIITIEKHK